MPSHPNDHHESDQKVGENTAQIKTKYPRPRKEHERQASSNPATSRLEIRITPQDKDLIEQAACVLRETTTTFVLQSLLAAAREVIRHEEVTVIPPDFYDAVIASLDDPPQRNKALTAAAQRNKDIFDR